MSRSPKRFTNRPPGVAATSRIAANTLTTEVAASVLTPNDLAKTGIIGTTMPYPKATKNPTVVRTATSRGKS